MKRVHMPTGAWPATTGLWPKALENDFIGNSVRRMSSGNQESRQEGRQEGPEEIGQEEVRQEVG